MNLGLPSLVGARVLVVDDQPELVEDLVEILTDAGSKVRTANSAAAALAAARAEPFDVALLDVQLPDGSGVALLPEIRAAAPGAEVLLVTGHGSLDHAIEALRVGAYAYVLKPFFPEDLLATVDRAARQARSTRDSERLQRSLERERDFTHAVLQTAGAIVIVTNPTGRVVQCNRAAAEAVGGACEATDGLMITDLLDRGQIGPLVPESFPQRREGILRGPTGEPRLVAWSNTALVDERGALTHLIFTGIDVTERTRAEAELREALSQLKAANQRLLEEQGKLLQAEKLSSLGQLCAGVAHEINNPLGGIKSCFSALCAGRVPEVRRGEYEQVITDGLDRIESTVRGLLDYARQSRSARGPVQVSELVEATLRLLVPATREKAIEPVAALGSEALWVDADRSQLMQALINVVLNAVYASPRAGQVKVAARLPEDAPEWVEISVSDEGPGIAAEVRDRVCDPFFTTKPEGEGTGLGLSVTQGIVLSHGGELLISGEQPRGARVTLRLPRLNRSED